jgi:SHS2 domain-containing protein
MGHYEFIEHTADVAIRAYGDSLEEAFATAAQAMFDIITDSAPVEPLQEIEIDITAMDRESLVVNFLSQLIVVHEVDRLVLGHFSLTFAGSNALHVIASGEPFDRERHGRGIHVKGVAYHMLEIEEPGLESPAMVQVLFDI